MHTLIVFRIIYYEEVALGKTVPDFTVWRVEFKE